MGLFQVEKKVHALKERNRELEKRVKKLEDFIGDPNDVAVIGKIDSLKKENDPDVYSMPEGPYKKLLESAGTATLKDEYKPECTCHLSTPKVCTQHAQETVDGLRIELERTKEELTYADRRENELREDLAVVRDYTAKLEKDLTLAEKKLKETAIQRDTLEEILEILRKSGQLTKKD